MRPEVMDKIEELRGINSLNRRSRGKCCSPRKLFGLQGFRYISR